MAQKEPARTKPIMSKPLPNLDKTLGESQFISPGPEDCEPSVDPENFGKGGVELEPEYDLELRIGGNVGWPSLLTVPNKTSTSGGVNRKQERKVRSPGFGRHLITLLLADIHL
jgi:hypothetical protein